jgi:hypothetical protein
MNQELLYEENNEEESDQQQEQHFRQEDHIMNRHQGAIPVEEELNSLNEVWRKHIP